MRVRVATMYDKDERRKVRERHSYRGSRQGRQLFAPMCANTSICACARVCVSVCVCVLIALVVGDQ